MKTGYVGGLVTIVVGTLVIVLAIALLPTINGESILSNPMNHKRLLAPLSGGLIVILMGNLLWLGWNHRVDNSSL